MTIRSCALVVAIAALIASLLRSWSKSGSRLADPEQPQSCACDGLGAPARAGNPTGEPAAHRPAATTTTAARLIWLAIAFALGRWLAEGLLNPQMGLEGVAVDLATPVLFLAISVGVVALLMTPATRRDFQSSR